MGTRRVNHRIQTVVDIGRPVRAGRWFAVATAVLMVAAGGGRPARAASGNLRGIVDVNTTLSYEDVSGAGTGMVLSGSGVVLTNNHVIEGATAIRVTDLDNGHSYRATVVGYDIAGDLAVLRLQGASGLETAPLGDSSTARVGEAISSFGNAGGLGGSPSRVSGKIVALNQTIIATDALTGSSEELSGLIESNAALEPGDSGGPLVGTDGRIVGIDTAGGSESFTFEPPESRGFAIPINRARAVATAIEAGRTSAAIHIGPTPFLGVTVAEITFSREQELGVGLLVLTVVPGSPVARTGLAAGDVITSLDGRATSSASTLTDLLLARSPGDRVSLGWISRRTDQAERSTVTLASGPPQ